MTHTIATAKSSCSIHGLDSEREAALAVYDYCVNHPDEIPEGLDDDEIDSDTFVDIVESYLLCQGGEVCVLYNSEDANCDEETFNFLSSHFACLQSSLFMTTTWNRFNVAGGPSGDTTYYDRSGRVIDIEEILTQALS